MAVLKWRYDNGVRSQWWTVLTLSEQCVQSTSQFITRLLLDNQLMTELKSQQPSFLVLASFPEASRCLQSFPQVCRMFVFRTLAKVLENGMIWLLHVCCRPFITSHDGGACIYSAWQCSLIWLSLSVGQLWMAGAYMTFFLSGVDGTARLCPLLEPCRFGQVIIVGLHPVTWHF